MKKLFMLIVFINFLIINYLMECQEYKENYECYYEFESFKRKDCFDIVKESIEFSKKYSQDDKPHIIFKELLDTNFVRNQKINDILNIVKQSYNLKYQTVLINKEGYITGGWLNFYYNDRYDYVLTFCFNIEKWEKAFTHNINENDEQNMQIQTKNLNFFLEMKDYEIFQHLSSQPVPIPDAEIEDIQEIDDL